MFATNRLGRVDPATARCRLSRSRTPERGRGARGARTDVIWYTDFARGYLGRLDPATSQVREWQIPGAGANGAYGVSLGTDGRVWLHDAGSTTMYGFDPRTQQFINATIPTGGATVRHMVTDYPRARLWLALSGSRRIGKLQLAPLPVVFSGTACSGSSGTPSFTVSGVARIGERGHVRRRGDTADTVGVLFQAVSDTVGTGSPALN